MERKENVFKEFIVFFPKLPFTLVGTLFSVRQNFASETREKIKALVENSSVALFRYRTVFSFLFFFLLHLFDEKQENFQIGQQK